MKFSHVVPLAALTSALVLPPADTFAQLAIEDHHQKSWYEEAVEAKDDILEGFKQYYDDVGKTAKAVGSEIGGKSKGAFDDAFYAASDAALSFQDKIRETAYDAQTWLEGEQQELEEMVEAERPRRPPHHGHDGHKPNLTVYQLIAGSKYTTTLAKLISEYDDLVDALNSTKANYTIFAPTDKAFAKIPEGAPKPSKEFLKKVLEYHVVPGFYPAGRVLASHTVATALSADHLSDKPEQQRLSFQIGFRGLTINFYSRVIAINIFGTNGVIHGVDSIIVPPPSVVKIIDLLPGEFSTLELGLSKTGLLDEFNTTDHYGGTLFAPSNFAFKKLGPRINGFLFSQYGLKYLKALLQYHAAPNFTLYSDAYYKVSDLGAAKATAPKGYFHLDLPTLLEDRSLAVDVARYGRFIRIKLNAFATVTVPDAIAEDGVIHVVSDVLVPPKKVGGVVQEWMGEDMSVDDFKERLEPLVAKLDL